LTAVPALIAVWLRLRTGSLLLPVVLHNFGNAISLLI
jgi:membrane protease YdiL (CAAX protease family)